MTSLETPMIRVMLVEDHAVVREGLRSLIQREQDMQVIAEARTIQEALDSDAEADLIVADLILGDSKGLETVQSLTQRFPASRLVILTMLGDLNLVRDALEEGAHGYLLKESAAAELIKAIRLVFEGGEYLQPSLGAALAKGPARTVSDRPSSLTERELEVLKLIALGHTNAEAARILGITAKTIEAHRNHIARKLGFKTRAEFVRFALDEKLIEGP